MCIYAHVYGMRSISIVYICILIGIIIIIKKYNEFSNFSQICLHKAFKADFALPAIPEFDRNVSIVNQYN